MSASWAEIYQQHFLMHFSKPFDVQVYHGADGAALKLTTYDRAMPGFRIYASTGMADRLARSGEMAVGEVILYSDLPDSEIPQLFVTALFFILQNAIPLTTRFSIAFAGMNPAFSKRTGKSALYFTRAFSPDGEFDRVAQLACVYQAFFITPAEDEFLEKEGAVCFEKEFWSQLGPDFRRDEPLRPPVDLQEMDKYRAKVSELWGLAARQLFSVQRPGKRRA
jgi:hypothetical protein